MLEIFQRLVRRNQRRTGAEIQADVRPFILSALFELEPGDLVDLSLESPVGDRKRIDVEAGSTVIEVKRDLRRERVRIEAEEQLPVMLSSGSKKPDFGMQACSTREQNGDATR